MLTREQIDRRCRQMAAHEHRIAREYGHDQFEACYRLAQLYAQQPPEVMYTVQLLKFSNLYAAIAGVRPLEIIGGGEDPTIPPADLQV